MIVDLNAFQLKLRLFSQHLSNKNLDHFAALQTLADIPKNKIKEYSSPVSVLNEEFSHRFGDFRKIEKSLSIVRDPFCAEIDSAPNEIQLEIIDLQCNPALKELHRREEICKFYCSLDSNKFANIRSFARKMLVIFASTYICEQTFSIMNVNKNSLRASMTDRHLEAVLKISTTNFEPDVEKMMTDLKQLHSSH